MNIASDKPGLSDAQRSFVDEMAALFAPWGLPPASGRVYAYVLLRETPVSLDQIAADLQLSKAGAWNAAKVLERNRHVRRTGQPGSKRSLYAPSYNYAAILLAHSATYGEVGGLLSKSAASVAATEGAAARLQEMGRFLTSMRAAIERTIAALQSQTPAHGDDA
jgi:hypothetical protein